MKNKYPDTRSDTRFIEIEYRKAQDSAEHHAYLGWLVTSLTVAGSLVLLGLLARSVGDPAHFEVSALAALLGLALSIATNLLHRKFADIARQKYERCKDLELKLGGKQHLELRSRGPSARFLVNAVTGALAVTWACVLLLAVFQLGRSL